MLSFHQLVYFSLVQEDFRMATPTNSCTSYKGEMRSIKQAVSRSVKSSLY